MNVRRSTIRWSRPWCGPIARRSMHETNLFRSVQELAKAEKINESYLCQGLRPTLLSPAITEAILNGLQPDELELSQLLKFIPAEGNEQQALFSSSAQREPDAVKTISELERGAGANSYIERYGT